MSVERVGPEETALLFEVMEHAQALVSRKAGVAVEHQPRKGGSMRLASFYAFVWFVTVVALTYVRFGGRPYVMAGWDGRSVAYFGDACLVTAFVACLGLVVLAPRQGLPRRLRAVPQMTALLLPSFIVLGVLKLAPASGSETIILMLAKWIGAGLALGFTTGVAASFSPEWHDDGRAFLNVAPRHTHVVMVVLLAAAVVAGLVLFSPFWNS